VKRIVYIFFFLLAANIAAGQQLPIYSQYLFNKFLINPSVAGNDGYTSFNLTAREQWVGYSGAPRTFSFSMQTRLLKHSFEMKRRNTSRPVYRPKSDGKVGLGGYVFSDKNGLIQRTGFQASYSYHMWLRNSTQLSWGLAVTGYHYQINEDEMNFEDPNEPWLNNELRRGMFVPDATFGVSVLNARYSFGFSADQLFEASAKIGTYAYNNFRMKRQYYLYGSYSFETSVYTEIEPTFLLVMSEQLKPQADIGVTYIYDKSFWGGLSYRTSGAIIFNVGVKYNKIFIGYAFDFTLQEIQRVTYGTHEITLALKFGDATRRYRWLDRY
jgi:type IX secretion system PorP/SprF family membrane protein